VTVGPRDIIVERATDHRVVSARFERRSGTWPGNQHRPVGSGPERSEPGLQAVRCGPGRPLLEIMGDGQPL